MEQVLGTCVDQGIKVVTNAGGLNPAGCADRVRQIARLMCAYVQAGGEIDRVPERRPEWNDRPFHYDLRIPIGGRLVYIETILLDDDPDDPTIRVVNIHDA